ncbi:hypothetical protein J3A98_001686 [Pseudomonas sp. BP6]|nr:hypothetical protein [Pseudomonas sp. BP6]MBP2290036.1 hypothetical protein [Pseudomonas sp. BP7]
MNLGMIHRISRPPGYDGVSETVLTGPVDHEPS